MFPFPHEPELPAEQQAAGEVATRYEDIAQDGRVKLGALPHGVGEVCWMKLLRHHAIKRRSRNQNRDGRRAAAR